MNHAVALALLACSLLCADIARDQKTPGEPAWARPLLDQVKLTPDKAQLDRGRWMDGGKYRLKTFQRLWDDWRLVDPTAVGVARDYLADADSFEALNARTAPLLDVKPLSAIAAQKKDGSLVDAIADLHIHLKKPLTDKEREQLEAMAKDVPADIAKATASLIRAFPDVLQQRQKAFARFDKLQTAYDRARALALGYKVDGDTLRLLEQTDMAALLQGGRVLGHAMDQAVAQLAKPGQQRFEFKLATPIGLIALGGAQDNTYDAGPYLLILDSGGNDRYTAGAGTTSAEHPISVILDLAGDDRYEAKADGAFGAGILGYGFLYDGGGKDVYQANRLSLGVASFGVGILVDKSGNDRYEIDRVGQGAAWFGVGILSDRDGNDEYHCYQLAQGMGGCRGLGLLVDGNGDDLYDANNKNIKYPSPQDNRHNTSLAQGCAFGRRAHPGDGNSLAGGIGLLIDGKGDDRYKCGLFGQGVSYWYGLGCLVDFEGKDSYDGVWYTQGSAAHYGVGALCDLGGDDKYFAKLWMSQGAAHDYSVALLHDAAGNDTYECPGSCMGFALYNGIGILWDEKGDDKYKMSGPGLGQTGETRPEHLTLGMFIDEGGTNEFPKDYQAKAKTTWAAPAKKGFPHAYGLGLSR